MSHRPQHKKARNVERDPPHHPDLDCVRLFLAGLPEQAPEAARRFVVETTRDATLFHAQQMGRGRVVLGTEDLHQAAQVHVLRGLAAYHGRSSLHTWTANCARNFILSLTRPQASHDTAMRGAHALDDIDSVLAIPTREQSALDAVIEAELVDRVQKAIARLPLRIRAVILQRMECRKHAEIARDLGVSRNTVLNLQRAGRTLLRAYLRSND